MRIFMSMSQIYDQNVGINKDSLDMHSIMPLIRKSLESKLGKAHISVIDEHLFIESIALISFELPYHNKNLSKVERIVLLLERMNSSQGANKVQLVVGKAKLMSGI